MNDNDTKPGDENDLRKGQTATAFMCFTAFENEIRGTSTRLFPSIDEHRAGCPCGKSGTVEVAVTYVRFVRNPEAVSNQRLKEQDLEQQRLALQGVVKRIHNLKTFLPDPLIDVPGSKGCEMVDFWLQRHEQVPNGHALFWALDSLMRLADANADLCGKGFWMALSEAGDELRNTWSVEAKTAKV